MMYDLAAMELTGALVCCSTFSLLGGGEKEKKEKNITGYKIKNNLHIQYSGKGQTHKAA